MKKSMRGRIFKKKIKGVNRMSNDRIPIIGGLRVRPRIYDALFMILHNKRHKRPGQKVYFCDMLRDALVEFIGKHSEFHDADFDYEALAKNYYANHSYVGKNQKESEV
jgi:hypothetical protein